MKKISLSAQIIIALILGVIVGLIATFTGTADFVTSYIKPIGDIFINLLQFVVIPVVLLSLIDGIISTGDMKTFGSIGVKTLLFFLGTTIVACLLALGFSHLFVANGWFPVLEANNVAANIDTSQFNGVMGVLVGMFPRNLWASLANGEMLQIIVISVMFGGAIIAAGEKAALAREVISSVYAVIDKLMLFVISLSPIGVFAYIAWAIAVYGAQIMGSLGIVILCNYICYAIQTFIFYGICVKVLAKMSPIAFLKKAGSAMIFAFSSASSSATIPVSKECAENLGVASNVGSFVIPLGAILHQDGQAIYQCISVVFLATCTGTTLTFPQLVMIVVMATLAAVGASGVPGGGIAVMSMVMGVVGIPLEYIGLIIAIDRIIDGGLTCTNITGDIVGAVCVSRWEEKRIAKQKSCI